MVAVAIVGAAAVGSVATVASGNKAANATKAAAASNTALAQDNYAKNSAVLAPYVGAGTAPTSSIQALLGLGGDQAAATKAFDNYRSGTGYDFRLSEGTKAMTAALGRGSMLESGAAAKAALKYGQNTASDEFQRYISNLTQQQNLGVAAASAQAGVGNTLVNNVTANNNNAAAGAASAALNTGNAINGALGNAASAYALNAGLKSSYTSGSALGGQTTGVLGGRPAGFDPTYNYLYGG